MLKAFTDPTYGRRNRITAGILALTALGLTYLAWRVAGIEGALLAAGGGLAFVLVGPYYRSVFQYPHAAFWFGSEPDMREERERRRKQRER